MRLKSIYLTCLCYAVLNSFALGFGLPKIGNALSGGGAEAFTLPTLTTPVGGAPSDPVKAFVFYVEAADELFKGANNQFDTAIQNLETQIALKNTQKTSEKKAGELASTIDRISEMGELDEEMKMAVREAQLSVGSALLLATAGGAIADQLAKSSGPAAEAAKANPLNYAGLIPKLPGVAKNLQGIATGAPSFILQAGKALKKLNDLATANGIEIPSPAEVKAVAQKSTTVDVALDESDLDLG